MWIADTVTDGTVKCNLYNYIHGITEPTATVVRTHEHTNHDRRCTTERRGAHPTAGSSHAQLSELELLVELKRCRASVRTDGLRSGGVGGSWTAMDGALTA
jgi:hypothetical protein